MFNQHLSIYNVGIRYLSMSKMLGISIIVVFWKLFVLFASFFDLMSALSNYVSIVPNKMPNLDNNLIKFV